MSESENNAKSANEHCLFEEYRELSYSWRADDERLAKLTPVLVPVSFAAFAVGDTSSHMFSRGRVYTDDLLVSCGTYYC